MSFDDDISAIDAALGGFNTTGASALSELLGVDESVLYLRVSSKKQMDTAIDIDPDGNSIATQRESTTRKAVSLGSPVVKEFIEPGVSASTIKNRPAFNEMLAYLRDHPTVKYVIVYARSRAFRNQADAVTTKILLDKLGIKIISAREDFGEGIHADMMEVVTDAINEAQNKLSGEDIRTKLRHKAINGGTIGRARLGYLNTRIELGGRMVNTVSIDPQRAPLILKAWELYASGDYSIDRLTATMADLGLTARPSPRWPQTRPVSDSKMQQMLRDPYYAGYVVYKGDIYPGRHEAIVGQELFAQVQDVLNARSARGQRDRILTHYLKGALLCARCHQHGRTARLIYTEATGRSGRRYGYFLCRARQDGLCDLPYLAAERVEDAVTDHYTTLQLPENFTTEVRTQLDITLADEQANVRELHTSFTRRLKDLDERESRLIDLAADGSLPQNKIRTKLHELHIDRQRIEASLAVTGEELAVGAAVLRNALHLLANPQQLYRDVPDQVRRHLNQTFYQCFYLDDCEVTSDTKTPLFAEIHDAVPTYTASTRHQSSHNRATNPHKHKSPGTAEALGVVSSQTDRLTLTDIVAVTGSSKTVMVELRGFEPLTPTLPVWCATSCAIAPCLVVRARTKLHHGDGLSKSQRSGPPTSSATSCILLTCGDASLPSVSGAKIHATAAISGIAPPTTNAHP